MKTKRILSAVIAAACAMGCTVSAFAQEPSEITYYSLNGQTVYSDPEAPVIAPRFQYLNSVDASISRSGSTITCTGSISIFKDYDVDIVVRLQRSTDGNKWSNVSGAIWTDTATKQGVTPVSGKFTATKGYRYRTTTTASVKNRSLESVTAISGVEYYL